ncbi:hypothetical protein [Campylobacter devanensis]
MATSGGGGMLITDDENIAKMAKHRAKDSNKMLNT